MSSPTILRLSEAISLGHTLIDESADCFLAHDDSCGCAIGSAIVALGDQERYRVIPLTHRGSGVEWCEERYPWTARAAVDFPVLLESYRSAVNGIPGYANSPATTVAHAISDMHCCGVPRLDIARLIAQIEPDPPSDTVADVADAAVTPVGVPA